MQENLLCIRNPVRKIVYKKASKLLREGWEKDGDIYCVKIESNNISCFIYCQNLKKKNL